jgi:hypothetical protein
MTTKGNCHIKNCKNSTRKWVADRKIVVHHVSRKSNVTDLFTKKMCDGANFCRLCDSFMSCSSNYLCGAHNIIHLHPPSSSPSSDTPILVQSVAFERPPHQGIHDVLIPYPSLCLPSMLFSISLACCHILSCLAPPSYMQVLLSDFMGGVSM